MTDENNLRQQAQSEIQQPFARVAPQPQQPPFQPGVIEGEIITVQPTQDPPQQENVEPAQTEMQPETQPQDRLALAEKAGNVWEFQGRKIEKYVATGETEIATAVLHPATKQPIGILVYDVSWNSEVPFIEREKALKLRSQTLGRSSNAREILPADEISANADFARSILMGGRILPLDGDESKAVELSREQVIAYEDEQLSQAVDDWFKAITIERYIPEGVNIIEFALMPQDTISFVAYIGISRENPKAVILFHFDKPEREKRRDFDTASKQIKTEQDGDVSTSTFSENFGAKFRFAKKYLTRGEGVAVGKPGVDLTGANKEDFGKLFNPYWLSLLATELSGAFNNTKGK